MAPGGWGELERAGLFLCIMDEVEGTRALMLAACLKLGFAELSLLLCGIQNEKSHSFQSEYCLSDYLSHELFSSYALL